MIRTVRPVRIRSTLRALWPKSLEFRLNRNGTCLAIDSGR